MPGQEMQQMIEQAEPWFTVFGQPVDGGQVMTAAVIAVISGVISLGFWLYKRKRTKNKGI